MRWLTGAEFAAALAARAGGFAAPPGVAEAVAAILAAVRARGDEALGEYTARFDGVSLGPGELEVPPAAVAAAARAVPAPVMAALETMRRRLEEFHAGQVPRGYRREDGAGNVLGMEVRPLGRVGIYAPGGRAAYPSTVLMAAVPARLAGVEEIVLCTPPGRGGEVDPVVLAAAAVAGVDRVFRVGGAQAIAALAYGTATVPRVDKIVGPGNVYVTEAKRQVFGAVAIDGLHGPSEVAVVADEGAPPAWVAADLLAQAEHDPLAVCVLLTPARALAAAAEEELERMLAAAPRGATARAALEGQGMVVVTGDLEEAVSLADALAPEHLQLMVADPEPWLARVRRAGAVFLGYHAPVAAGDYAAGTNHVLPTGGTARFGSGLGVADFVRRMDWFRGAPAGVAAWGPASALLAEREGLPGHAAAVRARMEEGAADGPAR